MWDKTDYDAPEHRTLEYQLFRLACLSILIGLLLSITMFALLPGIALLVLGGVLGIAAAFIWYFDNRHPHPKTYSSADEDPTVDHAPYWTTPETLDRRSPEHH